LTKHLLQRLCLGAIFFLVSCIAPRGPVDFVDPGLDQVWPASPAEPRIKLIRQISGAADLRDKNSGSNRLMRWLTGGDDEQLPLVAPYGIATDGQGTLWITDPGLRGIQVFDLARRKAGLWTMAGKRSFANPAGICFDPVRQRIYVADSLDLRVVALSLDGRLLFEVQPSAPWGRPGGLGLDSQGNLLVADVLLGQIRRFTPEGSELPAFGSPATVNGLFNRPIAVATDLAGQIYVVDSLNFKIEVLDAAGGSVATVGQLGDAPGSFSRPRGLAIDQYGHIYVADAAFDNVQIFNQHGQLLLFFGGGGKHGLSLPAGLTIDDQDRIYVVDSFNHRIQIYQLLKPLD
jgi:sugar lactone lactonase YvrE